MDKGKAFLLILIIICMAECSFVIYKLNSSFDSKEYWAKTWDKQVEGDPAIKKVANQCLLRKYKTLCVYEEIPFKYNIYKTTDFVNSSVPNLLTLPSEMLRTEGDGICRDIAVFRKNVLDELGVKVEYVFPSSTHVFIRVFEDGTIYEMDNSQLRVIK